MWKRKAHYEMNLTPEKAQQLLDINTFVGQRYLKPKHLRRMMSDLDAGMFLTGWVIVGIVNGVKILANGQHQSHMVIETGKTINVFYEEYECKTMEAFAVLYAYVDKTAYRSIADVIKATAISMGLPDWPRQFLKTFSGGVSIVEGQFDVDKNKRAESIGRYVYEGKFIYHLFDGHSASHLKRGPVVAAIIRTYQADSKKGTADATIFWKDVRDGANLSADSPALELHHFLLLSTVKNQKGLSGGRDTHAVGERAMFAKCITAWNAFRRNKTTKLQYYPDKPVPQAI